MIKSILFIALLFFPVLGIAQEIMAPPMVIVPRVMSFSKDVQAANAVITGKEHQNRAIAFSIQQLIDENADLFQTVQEQARTIETLRGHVQKTGEVFDEAVDAAYAAKNALLKAEVALRVASGEEMVKMKGDMAALNYQLETARQDLKAVTDARNAEKQETAERLVEFQGRLKEALDINEDQQQKIAAYKTRMKEFKKDTNAKELSVSMMQAIIDQKSADYADTTAVFTAKIAGLQERLAVAEEKLKTSVPQEDLARVQAMLKSSREEIASLALALKDKDAGVAKMRSQLASNAKEFSAQLVQLERLKVQIDDGRKKIETMGKQIARLKMQLDESRKKAGQSSVR